MENIADKNEEIYKKHIKIDYFMENYTEKMVGIKNYGMLHEFACHLCTGVMLIFSVSFQF